MNHNKHKSEESVQDYLETIYILSKEKAQVRSIDIANELGFSKPSVSVAMKSLRENGYIDVLGDGKIILLESGRKIAEKLYERHIVLTSALISLGVSEEIASEDACRIEHIISEETFECIKNHVVKMNK